MQNDVATVDAFEAKPRALHRAPPQGTVGGPGAPTSADGSWDVVRMLSRTLRGRYRLTLVLALLAAGIGAAAGWSWAGPLYRS